MAQQDRDARWVVKQTKGKSKEGKEALDLAITLYGYKNHLSIDRCYGFVRRYHTSAANLHDGKAFSQILDKENTCGDVWGDTAYRSEKNEEFLREHGFTSKLHRKKLKGKPMSHGTERANGKKSKIRAKVESGTCLRLSKR